MHRDMPYATAQGFYQGDRVEDTRTGALGVIERVFGAASHAAHVRLDNGLLIARHDGDLTRSGDD